MDEGQELYRAGQHLQREAQKGYLRWGAGPTTRIAAPVEQLDLATVVQASQLLSGEIVLERLIERLTVSAVEHAGADRGLLFLVGGDEPRVEAEAIMGRERVTVSLRQAGLGAAQIPESMLRYVVRTQETVILDDASTQHPFSADPYIIQKRCRSVLCLPLLRQASLKGVLYLENSLSPQAFTQARMEALGLLASQAAISLDNAQLYADLKQAQSKTQQAEQELRRVLDTISASLRRSEAYLAQAQRLTHTGTCAMRISSGQAEEIGWSKETVRLLGLDETAKSSLENALQRIHPEDVALVRQAVDEAGRSGAGLDLAVRLVMSDGSLKHIHVVADTMKDDSGDVELVGAAQDITAWKKALEESRALRDRLFQENVALREEVDKASMFEDIVGSSPPLQAVLSRVCKVAPTDSRALITGETGTGKELIARAIHRRSPRSLRPFVAVNCAAIPKDLIASELFGHEKGAFTGALQRRVGRFELAEGGTLFLDEVGEIPPEIQVALLRVLQERRFERVGGTQSISNDVRVIATTNVDLDAAMNAGAFRRDLFYRLSVFPIHMPSLRERREDIPLLVEYFIERFATQAGKRFRHINKTNLDLLQSYDWPGNIRELQNVIERSVIVCDTKEFSVDEHWLASRPLAKEPKQRTLDEQLIGEETKLIEAALAESGGKVSGSSGAAVKLGMPATTLYSKIHRLKIDRRRFKRH